MWGVSVAQYLLPAINKFMSAYYYVFINTFERPICANKLMVIPRSWLYNVVIKILPIACIPALEITSFVDRETLYTLSV